jgi:hypothetical protein
VDEDGMTSIPAFSREGTSYRGPRKSSSPWATETRGPGYHRYLSGASCVRDGGAVRKATAKSLAVVRNRSIIVGMGTYVEIPLSI